MGHMSQPSSLPLRGPGGGSSVPEIYEPRTKMKCVMTTAALKRWGKVIHALTSIGDQRIQLLFGPHGLAVTALKKDASDTNASVVFDINFFVEYEEAFRGLPCTVLSKHFLKPFRSLRFLTKFTNTCEIRLDRGRQFLTVILRPKYGGAIEYSMEMVDGPSRLEQEVDPLSLRHLINSDAKLYASCLSNFSHGKGVTELTVKATGDRVYLKNCMNEIVKRDGKIYTELCIHANDFEEYDVCEECELTIDMKQFKTFVQFAESMKLPVALHFNSPSEPLVVTGRSEECYYARMTISAARPTKGKTTVKEKQPARGKTARVSDTNGNAGRLNTVGRQSPPSPDAPENNNRSNDVGRQSPPPHAPDAENNKSSKANATALRAVFPNLGDRFQAVRLFPGFDDELVPNSDEEEC